VPGLRVIDDALWDAGQAQIERRLRPSAQVPVGTQNRKKHLLSGLINCNYCGANYTISGEDYYVRRPEVTWHVYQHRVGAQGTSRDGNAVDPPTSSHDSRPLPLFVEFEREVDQLGQQHHQRHDAAAERLVVVERDLQNLTDNLLPRVISPMLQKLLREREAAKACLEAQIASHGSIHPSATILPPRLCCVALKKKSGAFVRRWMTRSSAATPPKSCRPSSRL
jgi:site-specific DNA recombinase